MVVKIERLSTGTLFAGKADGRAAIQVGSPLILEVDGDAEVKQSQSRCEPGWSKLLY